MSAPFADRLHGAVEATGTPIVVGLDPHLALLPDEYAVARDAGAPRAERAAAMERFLLEIVDLCAGAVPAVKPQAAFFEVLGADGVAAFERVVAAAKVAGLLVIGDVKRGDIGSTAAAYAEACLSGAERSHMCDAATVNPYLGSDSITPFVDACRAADAGIVGSSSRRASIRPARTRAISDVWVSILPSHRLEDALRLSGDGPGPAGGRSERRSRQASPSWSSQPNNS